MAANIGPNGLPPAVDCRRFQKGALVPRQAADVRCRVCTVARPQANLDFFDFDYFELEDSDICYQYLIIAEDGCHFRKETVAPYSE